MKFAWGFGKGEMEFEVPDDLYLGTVEGVAVQPLPDLEAALEEALEHPIASPPLAETVQPGDRVAIACPDYHRLWVQARRWLPLVVRALNRAGIPDRDITVIIANGTHGKPSYRGMQDILGEDFPPGVKVVNHDARDPSMLCYLGKTPYGTPVWVNRHAVEADHVILTGAVVPHTFAGFGGGRKAVLPGMSGISTILANHSRALSDTVGGGTHRHGPARCARRTTRCTRTCWPRRACWARASS